MLRRFTPDDIPALYAILRDEKANTFLPWFPAKSLAEATEFYRKHYAEAPPDAHKYAICLKSDDIPIGYVHVGGGDSYDLGYGLRSEYWHRGIATEACKAVIERLRETDIPYITATHDVRNPRSGGVMRNLGMAYHYTYEELWQPKNITVLFRMYQLNFDGRNERVYWKYWDESTAHFVEGI
jgi:RimJ/RimL family protein N-acetyltransferase